MKASTLSTPNSVHRPALPMIARIYPAIMVGAAALIAYQCAPFLAAQLDLTAPDSPALLQQRLLPRQNTDGPPLVSPEPPPPLQPKTTDVQPARTPQSVIVDRPIPIPSAPIPSLPSAAARFPQHQIARPVPIRPIRQPQMAFRAPQPFMARPFAMPRFGNFHPSFGAVFKSFGRH